MSSESGPQYPRQSGARKKGLNERQTSDEGAPPVIHGYVKSFDGTKLFYSKEGKGKALVFCYGLVCSSLHWTYQIEHFRRNFQAIWFDYRGHQNSEIPKDIKTITIPNMAQDLRVVLDELGVQQAVVLGHSMGVNVVLEFYRQNPDRVAGMVLCNGTARKPLENLLTSNISSAGFELLKKAHQISPELVSRIWKLQKGNPLTRTLVALGGFNLHLTPPEDVQAYVDQVTGIDPSIFIQLIENYDSYDATGWLHTVRVPTLIMGGEIDKVTPPDSQRLMHQLIPGSQLEIIRHGSHCSQMDLPELVNIKIEKFLDEINYGSTTNLSKENANPTTESHQSPAPSSTF